MNFSPWLNLDNLILIHKAGQVVHLTVNYILSDRGLVVIVCHTSMAPNCKSFLSDTMSLASSISHASWAIDVPPIHIGTIKCPVLPTLPSLLWNILAQQYLPNTIQHPSTPLIPLFLTTVAQRHSTCLIRSICSWQSFSRCAANGLNRILFNHQTFSGLAPVIHTVAGTP